MPVCVHQQDYLAWKGASKGKPQGVPQGSGDLISTILKKSASGDDQFFVRKARVIGLGELLFFYGEKFTAGELYAYFVNARKLTCKRPRAWTNAARRQQLLLWQQVINHHALTNTWGMGRETPVHQPDRREREARHGKRKARKVGSRPVAAVVEAKVLAWKMVSGGRAMASGILGKG